MRSTTRIASSPGAPATRRAEQEEEASAYRVAGLPYKPRRAPFQSVSELWLLLGLPPQLVEHVLPFVTVFSGRPDIDAAVAAPTVVAAQPGMTPEKLQGVLDARAATAAGNGRRLGGAPAPAPQAEGGGSVRVKLRIGFDNGRQIRAEAVILIIEGDEEPYRILSWQDDFDGPG